MAIALTVFSIISLVIFWVILFQLLEFVFEVKSIEKVFVSQQVNCSWVLYELSALNE